MTATWSFMTTFCLSFVQRRDAEAQRVHRSAPETLRLCASALKGSTCDLTEWSCFPVVVAIAAAFVQPAVGQRHRGADLDGVGVGDLQVEPTAAVGVDH